LTRHIGSCNILSGAIRKYLGSYEVKKIGLLPFAKQTLKNFSPFISHFSRKRTAFTLAEVLITLGIIGIVAALTMPSLIQNYRNKVVETRLQKFYSTMNQAIALAEIDYGPREDWYNLYDVDTDKNGNAIEGTVAKEKWAKKYILPYMKTVKKLEADQWGQVIMYFADGSMVYIATDLADWAFRPSGKCKKGRGICEFMFNYTPIGYGEQIKKHAGQRFEPYKFGWNGTLSHLESDCKNNQYHLFCTALIQYHGWKIPKNYPFKVTY